MREYHNEGVVMKHEHRGKCLDVGKRCVSEETSKKLSAIFLKYRKDKDDLLSILQDIQDEFGYLPEDALHLLSKEIKVPENEIYGVATFYAIFKFESPAKHRITVCLGTACYVNGSSKILDEAERKLGIKAGETTENGQISLDHVFCNGCCGHAPVVIVDNDVSGGWSATKLSETIDKFKEGSP
jgi:NADH:ubiquinone oxidoreductase subunit E